MPRNTRKVEPKDDPQCLKHLAISSEEDSSILVAGRIVLPTRNGTNIIQRHHKTYSHIATSSCYMHKCTIHPHLYCVMFSGVKLNMG